MRPNSKVRPTKNLPDIQNRRHGSRSARHVIIRRHLFVWVSHTISYDKLAQSCAIEVSTPHKQTNDDGHQIDGGEACGNQQRILIMDLCSKKRNVTTLMWVFCPVNGYKIQGPGNRLTPYDSPAM